MTAIQPGGTSDTLRDTGADDQDIEARLDLQSSTR